MKLSGLKALCIHEAPPDSILDDIFFPSLLKRTLKPKFETEVQSFYPFIRRNSQNLRIFSLEPCDGWSEFERPTTSIGQFPNLIEYTGDPEIMDFMLLGPRVSKIDLALERQKPIYQQFSCLNDLPLVKVRTHNIMDDGVLSNILCQLNWKQVLVARKPCSVLPT